MITRQRRLAFLWCGLFLFSGAIRAAQTEAPPFIPVLRTIGAEQPVRLRTLAVKIEIRSGFAEIGLDMIFFNPNSRVLEGELQFPLSPGQEISGIGLDVGGELRNGVPVPKARGQEIFEDIVRRNVDPALLEATRGNFHKLRVYPIPANGTRRVVVRVLQPLVERDGMLTLRLPLAFAKHLDKLDVEALVAANEEPRVESGALGLVLGRAGSLYRGRVEKSDLSPEGWLVISLPAPATPEKGFTAVRWGGKVYFTSIASAPAKSRKRVLPETVTIVWDASGSGRERDHAREFDLLDRYFAALGDGKARLVVVRNAAEKPEEFAVRRGDWKALKSRLNDLAYDGGTNLASWKPTDDCKEYLLFTDGLANFGENREGDALPAMLPGQRLYAIVASIGADRNLLRHAAGGRLVDLTHAGGDAAARALLEESTRAFLDPDELAGGGEALLDPLSSFAEGGGDRLVCRLAGWVAPRGDGKEETVTLRLEHPDGTREAFPVVVPPPESVPVHDEEDAPLPARLWGRYAMSEMEADAHRHKAAMARLGRELGIVSRETSLIVLETAEEYARWDVSPPASLRAEVERLRRRGIVAGNSGGYLPMKRLEAMWAERIAWWEKDFSKKNDGGKKETPSESAGMARRNLIGGRERGDGAAAPMNAEMADMSIGGAPMAMRVLPAPAASAENIAAYSAEGQDAAPAKTDNAVGIALRAWKSDAPYIERMNRAKKEDMYAIYLDELPGYTRSSAFFLDMADRFFAAGMPELGLRILSNLAEIEVENRRLLRMLAYRLMEAKEAGLALAVLERVRELAPNEPQSLRDLANAHRALGEFPEAADLLHEVARRAWDDRFPDVNVIALTELNALLATAGETIDVSSFDSRLIRNLPVDLRVVLTWDADNTDMDLWVTDPDNEKCYYENRLTRQGGAMSRDCTGGYGPEEFMLRKAKPGVYRVEVDYYGSSQQVLSGEVTFHVVLTTGFGTSGEEERVVTMRLKEAKENILVGEFTVR